MRFLQICRTFSYFLIFHKFTRHSKENFGTRLKLACETLGITFIKLGQILSMRYDILSRKNCESLQQLLDHVAPIPTETVVSILEKEYGTPHAAVFRAFCHAPIGSASVSQVHKAELFDGSIVAVKIKRPDVDNQFFNDMRILKILARVAVPFSRTLRTIQVTALVGYFESWVTQDLDFVTEVENMKKCREQYAFGEKKIRPDLGRGIFPLPYESLCTENIIVMDYIEGIPMSRKGEILANADFDIEKSIRTYVNVAMRNWSRDDIPNIIFQGDPHLSNILALPNGDVASIDYGLISELSQAEVRQAKDLIIAVYLQDLKKVLKVATAITEVDHEKYAPIIRQDMEAYLQKTKYEGFGFWFLEFVRVMIKHKIKFPLYLTTFGRTNLILDGVVKTYMPGRTTVNLLGKELQRIAINETLQNFKDIDWIRLTYSLSEKVKQAPDLLSDFIDDPLHIISEVAKAIKTA